MRFSVSFFLFSPCYSHREHWGLFSRDILFAFEFLMTNVCLSFRLLSSSSRCPRGDGLREEQQSHPEKRKPSRRRNRNKFESFAKVWCQHLKSSSKKSVFVLGKRCRTLLFHHPPLTLNHLSIWYLH